MPRFARMIEQGMVDRGHQVECWTSPSVATRIPISHPSSKKWLGYADEFLLFPQQLGRQLTTVSPDTLIVVTDQALGTWVPRIATRPHVIHCHDFLAQRSALREDPENPTSWTGKWYQRSIRQGYRKGQHSISVSHRSQSGLHRFIDHTPDTSDVVHNGLNGEFRVIDRQSAISVLGERW
jgi:hypothetical protein